jgi:CTD small phosphatase-like protein 2
MVNKYFEVIVFTASHKYYADVILDYIDPEKKLIQHRLYREHCIPTSDGVYIKDLRIFKNRDLKDLIIVDNAIYSFGYQLSNGIPIIPFKDDKDDIEFTCLMHYLEKIKDEPDFRVPNREAFKMEQVHKFNLGNYINYYVQQEQTDSDEETKETSDNNDEDNSLPE